MDDQVPSKPELLFAMIPLQQATTRLLFAADNLKRQGDLPGAIALYKELISTCRAHLALAEQNNSLYPDSPFDLAPIVNPLLDALLIQADLRELTGERQEAEVQRDEALRLADMYLPKSQSADRQRQRARALIGQGRLNEALTMLAAARDVAKTLGKSLAVANITIDIAAVLEWLGDFERALAEAQTCVDEIQPFMTGGPPKLEDALAAGLDSRFEEAKQITTLFGVWLELKQVQARCNRYLGNLAEAERQFKEVLPLIPDEGRVGIDYQLAAIQIAAGRFAEGLAALNSMEPFFTEIARSKLGAFLSAKAEAMLGLGQPQATLEILARAVPELLHYQDNDVLWRAYDRQGRAFAALGQPAPSLAAYGKATEVINGLRKAPLGYRLDSTHLRDKIPVFEHAMDLACDRGEGEACCQFIKKVKSRGLVAALSIPRLEQPASASDLERQFEELSQEIDALEFSGFREGPEQTEPRRQALLAQRADLLERLRLEDPRWRSLSEPVPFDLSRVMDLLAGRRQAALSLYYRPDQVLAVLLWNGRCAAVRMTLSEKTRDALAAYVANLELAEPDSQRFDPAALGLKASDLVPGELLEKGLAAASLVVAPHGLLHLLPWAALQHDGQRLFERWALGIIPNLSCLPALAASFAPAPRLALFGAPDYRKSPRLAPLLFGEVELNELEGIYQSHGGLIGKIRKKKEATEAAFWELALNPEGAGATLHVCCHGKFETGEPMHSGLEVFDGRVDAAEIARARLPYDEVVLSACSTGHRPTEVGGIHLVGDDIVGLPGAFLEAGVRSVLVSIPPAGDEVTWNFMRIYHERRATGATPLTALQHTQREMLLSPRYPPCLWVGFTVYGYQ